MSISRSNEILIVGLGSPIMKDDAVGLRVSETIGDMHLDNVDSQQEAIGGLDILPVISGYKMAIIVDAIMTQDYGPGSVIIFDPEDFESTIADVPAHDVNLATAIKIGRGLHPETMPDSVRFVAIEVEDIQTMSETMSPSVEAAVQSAVNAVLHLISEYQKSK
ncbi:MAG: hydrogenase maturation protease [Candidatus Methanomethylophilaceae archaeon]|nr:hydrogenase maturation protease [Candidatus Methanomethylophilaceae archaeon]